MKYVRVCYSLKLMSGGLWGSGKRLLEADMVTTICVHPKGFEIPCVQPTYIKGLLRRSLEETIHHLERAGIVSSDVVNEIFGPLTPFKGDASPRACNTVFGPLYPVKGVEVAKELAKSRPFEYLHRDDVLAKPHLYSEPHVRLDDRCRRASIGALFKELRVAPSTLLYGEILHYLEDPAKAVYIARALVIGIARLRYRYAGKRTVVESYVLSVEPPDLAKDEIVSYVLNISLARGLGA